MNNREIPELIRQKKNRIAEALEKHMSDDDETRAEYKGQMILGALSIRNLCEDILILAEKYQPPIKKEIVSPNLKNQKDENN